MGKVRLANLIVAIMAMNIAWALRVESSLQSLESQLVDEPERFADGTPLNMKDLMETISSNSKESRADFPNMIIEFKGGHCKTIQDFKAHPIHCDRGASRGKKIKTFVDMLRQRAETVQREVIKILTASRFKFTPIWTELEMYVEGLDPELKSYLETWADWYNIKVIRDVYIFHSPPPPQQSYEVDQLPPWHLQQINRDCPEASCRGKGVVVAILDTGVWWNQPKLEANYRKVHGWFDPYNNTKLPFDDDGRGTGAAGIIAGVEYGVANQANWIACRAFPIADAKETIVKACGQWALCPELYDTDGNELQTDSCDNAPHIINFSWAFGESDQVNIGSNFLYKTIQAWNAAGILSNFAAGDGGPFCGSVRYPATFPISFAIGAVDDTNTSYLQSSRGPGRSPRYDGEMENCGGVHDISREYCRRPTHGAEGREMCTLIKPDLSAPGVYVVAPSVWEGYDYELVSGTYVATAVVSGVAALMVCASNEMRGPVEFNQAEAAQILRQTASTDGINVEEGNVEGKVTNWAKISHLLCDLEFGEICQRFPNNVYGAGIVNACEAVKQVKRRPAGIAGNCGWGGWGWKQSSENKYSIPSNISASFYL